MKLHIEPKDDMSVYDIHNLFSLNYDNIETTFSKLEIDYDGDEVDEKVAVLTVEPKFNDDDGKYDIQRKIEKICDTIKLAYKLGVIK
jgi:hypothetical protein